MSVLFIRISAVAHNIWSLSFDALREFWKLANILSVNFRSRSTKLISALPVAFFLIGIHAIQG